MVEDPLDRANRQIDGLMKSYGAVEREQIRHSERIEGQKDDILRLTQAIVDVDRHCEERTQRLENAMTDQTKALKGKIESAISELKAERAAQTWTTKDRVLVYVALIAVAGGALQAVLP